LKYLRQYFEGLIKIVRTKVFKDGRQPEAQEIFYNLVRIYVASDEPVTITQPCPACVIARMSRDITNKQTDRQSEPKLGFHRITVLMMSPTVHSSSSSSSSSSGGGNSSISMIVMEMKKRRKLENNRKEGRKKKQKSRKGP